ncbi:MAG: tail fiber protein, partial [bacterium]|nr:tail fiber protein [bacterium]
MKRNTFFSGVVSMGLVCLFAFSGCEEGLGSGTYSFSDMYERMNVMEAEIERLKATSDRVDIIGGMTDYGSSISSLQIEQSDNTQRVSALESRVGDFSSSALDLQEEIQNLKLKTSPPGTINPFAGVNVPEGWLLCDGQAYGRTEHSELFQVIGTAWGSPDDSRFNVPDLRG